MIDNDRYLILLVEDDPAQAFLATKLLEASPDARFRVDHVSTLGEAMERLDQAAYDVLLLDLGLPDAFGLQGVHRLCQERPTQPFVVLTAADEPNMARAAIKLGAQDYIVKDKLRREVFARAVLHTIDRTRARQRIRRNAEDVAALINVMADGVLVIDAAGQILYANAAAAEFYGTQAALMHGELFEHPVVPGTVVQAAIGQGSARATVHLRASPVTWRERDAHVVVMRTAESCSAARATEEEPA